MKNKKYRHMGRVERREIGYFLRKGYGIRGIAELLDRDCGTVCREIQKNSVKGVYDPDKASQKAYVRRKYSKYQGMKVVEDWELKRYVENGIRRYWSPENISDRIRNIDKHVKYISAKGVYKYLYGCYGGTLPRFLFYKGKERKPGNEDKKAKLKDRVFIDKRPKYVICGKEAVLWRLGGRFHCFGKERERSHSDSV